MLYVLYKEIYIMIILVLLLKKYIIYYRIFILWLSYCLSHASPIDILNVFCISTWKISL